MYSFSPSVLVETLPFQIFSTQPSACVKPGLKCSAEITLIPACAIVPPVWSASSVEHLMIAAVGQGYAALAGHLRGRGQRNPLPDGRALTSTGCPRAAARVSAFSHLSSIPDCTLPPPA